MGSGVHLKKWKPKVMIYSVSMSVIALAHCNVKSKISTTTRGGKSAAVATPNPSPRAVSLRTLEIASSTTTPYVGQTINLTAKGTFTDNSTTDLTNNVTWSSSSKSIQISSNTGIATAISEGTATITAAYKDVSGILQLSSGIGDLKRIIVLPGSGVNRVGVAQQFAALGIYASGAIADITPTVTWSSSSTSVATVDSNLNYGLAPLLSPGTATISASLGGITASRALTVDTPTLTSLAIKPASLLIAVGYKTMISVTGTYSDGRQLDLTSAASWSSGNTGVASVSDVVGAKGLITSVAAGSATITASILGISTNSIVKATNATLSSLTVKPSTLTLGEGTTAKLQVDGTFSDASKIDLSVSANWDSSSTAVTVNNVGIGKGLVTASRNGTATVTASQNSISGTAGVTVSAAALQSISVTPSLPSITPSGQVQFKATGTFSDASTQDITSVVTWSSSDTTVAAIASSDSPNPGLAAGLASGSTTIKASFDGISGSRSLTVSSGAAASLSSIVVTPSSSTLSVGVQTQFGASGLYTDGTVADLTATAIWTTNDGTILQNDGTGLFTALTGGSTTVKATSGSVSGTAVVTSTALQAAPPTPTGLSGTPISGSQLNFSWSSGGGTTASYRYSYASGAVAPAACTTAPSATTSQTSVSLTGLSASTQYTFIVCALNTNTTPSSSAATAGVTVSTTQALPPNVTGLTATNDTATQVTLNWTSGGGTTASYKIAYQSGASAPADCASGTTTTSGINSKSITGLTGGTQYAFRVCALNSNPTPDMSSGTTVSSIPAATPPDVTGLTASNDTATQVTLSWTSGGGSTASYKIAYQSGASAPANCSSGTTTTSGTNSKSVTGLTGGTQYSFRVCALNSNVTPEVSAGATVSSTPAATPPDVTGLSATANSQVQITLSWTSGGGSTSSYKIAYQSGASAPADCVSGTTTTSGTTSKAVTGLSAGTQYAFRVCALNSNVTPESSSGVTATGTSFPGSFTISSATNGNTQSVVTWPASTGAASYTLKYGTSTGSYGTTVSTTATSPATVTGLTNGTTYYFMVTAVNAGGSTNATSEITATPTAGSTTFATYNSGSGNFTVPAGVTAVTIEVWGGGGGGGGGDGGAGQKNGAGGGGGGGYTIKNNLTVTPGQTIAYVVGAGGGGGSNGGINGPAGATSSVSGTYIANGGLGGAAGANTNIVAGGAGGTASGGDTNTTGTAGSSNDTFNDGGAGGAGAHGGAGGAMNAGGGDGNVGSAPGGGGCGGGKNSLGAAGGAGRVKFSWAAAPGAFTIASATNGNTQSIVTWGTSSGATSYTLKYGTSTGSYGTTVSTNATSPATVTGLTNGTTYYFMVIANNTGGATNATAEATATPTSGLTTQTFTTPGSNTFLVPAGVTTLIVEAWGGGGGTRWGYSGGGGGGAYSKVTLSVTQGDVISYTVAAGGTGQATNGGAANTAGGDSSAVFNSSTVVLAKGGAAPTDQNGAAGGQASSGTGDVKYSGGTGGTSAGPYGGSGASSAGTGSNGTNGSSSHTNADNTTPGAVAPAGGGNGGIGDYYDDGFNSPGASPGGGGGGSPNYGYASGQAGGNGKMAFSY